MECISNEAAEDGPLVFSDNEDEKIIDELDDFIDNVPQPEKDVSFYRQLDPVNLDDYPKFRGQTRDPIEVTYEDNTPFYGHEDKQSELYAPENRESVSFDKVEGSEKSIEKFTKALKNFEGSENQLLDAVIYGIMYHRYGDEPIAREKIFEVLGENLFNDLKEIDGEIKLDRTLFAYFDRCFKLNEVLAKHNYFLKFFERRDIYRFLIKKKVQGKNEVTRNLSSSILQKFDGYEMIRNDLSHREKAEVIPINVVYEPTYDETISVLAILPAKFI